jgi:thiamine-phosphate pyrophosphorylase
MDTRLVAWARAVKARSRKSGVAATQTLWLFTDAERLADPLAAAARLPKGLGGVVLRHDGDPNRAALGRALARICRQRRLALVVAGDWRLARSLGAGLHLRAGRWQAGAPAGWTLITSSAHGTADLRRARRHGASLAFLSPVFATASHPGAAGLGVIRWTGLAVRAGMPVAALGGIDAASIIRLPRDRCAGAGAIGALKVVHPEYT